MRVLETFPPNYADINRVFQVRGKPILFCYGDVIHNPSRIKIPPELMVHESIHSQRQGADPKSWWDWYLGDHNFRFDEELPAHIAEFAAFRSVHPERAAQQSALHRIAARLSSPLYGSLIDYHEARGLIEEAMPEFEPHGAGGH